MRSIHSFYPSLFLLRHFFSLHHIFHFCSHKISSNLYPADIRRNNYKIISLRDGGCRRRSVTNEGTVFDKKTLRKTLMPLKGIIIAFYSGFFWFAAHIPQDQQSWGRENWKNKRRPKRRIWVFYAIFRLKFARYSVDDEWFLRVSRNTMKNHLINA